MHCGLLVNQKKKKGGKNLQILYVVLKLSYEKTLVVFIKLTLKFFS